MRDTEGETVRSFVGALILLEAIHDLKIIRKALTTPEK